MNHTASKERNRSLLLWSLLITAFVLLILQGEPIKRSALDCLIFAGEKLVPSLFLFSILAKIAITLPQPKSPHRLALLSLPLSALPALALGLFSGFPTGAMAAKDLFDRGYLKRREAIHLALYADNAGLAFLLFSLSPLFEKRHAGVILFLAQTAASLLVGILLQKKEDAAETLPFSTVIPSHPLPVLISEAVISAASAMLTLTGFFTLFGTLAATFSSLDLPRGVITAFVILLEPTAAARHLAESGGALALPLTAFALGFSGLSVMFQRMSVWKNELPFWPLVGYRLVIGLLSFLFSFILIKIL